MRSLEKNQILVAKGIWSRTRADFWYEREIQTIKPLPDFFEKSKSLLGLKSFQTDYYYPFAKRSESTLSGKLPRMEIFGKTELS